MRVIHTKALGEIRKIFWFWHDLNPAKAWNVEFFMASKNLYKQCVVHYIIDDKDWYNF